jgi:hypothetical protein
MTVELRIPPTINQITKHNLSDANRRRRDATEPR